MPIDVSDRQLDQDFEDIKTFGGLYHQLYQNDVQSFIGFVLRFDLDSLFVFIVRDEYRCIVEQSLLDSAAYQIPRLPFVVFFKVNVQQNLFVEMQTHCALLFKALQVIGTAWWDDCQGDAPN